MSRQDAVIANPWTGDYRIDALIEGPSYRWNFDRDNPELWGQPTRLSFSFMTGVPDYAFAGDGIGFKEFTEAQRAAVRDSLQELSLIINVDFEEIVETPNRWGQLRFGNNLQSADKTAGYTYLPNDDAAGQSSGDVYIAVGFDRNYQEGGADRETLLHEIGHALGLKHPGDYERDGAATTQKEGNFLGQHEDSTLFTIMSYQTHIQGLNRSNFGIYDLLALRKMYGTRDYRINDDHYRFTSHSGDYQSTLLDDGGNDTIDLSALSSGVEINLNPGAFSSIGTAPVGKRAIDNLSIALGTLIESVVGTNYSDQIEGNALSNRIEPLSGFDTINGGPGVDTVVYGFERAMYQITPKATETFKQVIEVQATSTSKLTKPELKRDELTDIERIQFKDVGLALDMDLHAGLAVKLLHLVFGKQESSLAQNGTVLRYVDQFSLSQGEMPVKVAEDLLSLDAFWGTTSDRTDRGLVTLLLQRIWLQDSTSFETAQLINDLVPIVPMFGGQVGLIQYIANHHDFEQQIDFTQYANNGLLWT